jgi:DNA-binding transcriptional LysR family regulator
MTLEQLRIFVAVAERQHVTLAARALNLAQPAASHAIAALELQHDTRLFDRVPEREFHVLRHLERYKSRAAEALLALVATSPVGRTRRCRPLPETKKYTMVSSTASPTPSPGSFRHSRQNRVPRSARRPALHPNKATEAGTPG